MGKPGRKQRAEFRKNRAPRVRTHDWTRHFSSGDADEDALPPSERISGKGDLVRRRTVVVRSEATGADIPAYLDVDESQCRRGRVLSVHGLVSMVQDSQGDVYRCTTRRLLRTLSTDQRHVVAAGDVVLFRPAPSSAVREGVIERIEPRWGTICRESKGRRHVIVANVDQVLVVASAAEPPLKPNLIDRMLVAAEQSRIRPVICINKIDLVEPSGLEPLVGVYSRMGYTVLLLSAVTGFGIARLRRILRGHISVLAGQSGVGKSSLLNAVDSRLRLAVRPVSHETKKGRHTTSTARLLPLEGGGWVVDTPGVRQFQPWDLTAEEVVNYYRDLRPYVSYCHFPNCTHTHEAGCAIKDAVADGRLDAQRYESYCRLRAGEAG